VDRTFGPLTAFVNNAGILDQQTRVEHMTATRLQRIFTTNIMGAFCAHAKWCAACQPRTAALVGRL
jgi:NAD(P)-dependent dehydrogenase (short-subunit alcohol dehydrogenase family)